MPHEVKGLWMARMVPVKAVGGGLPIQFFYCNSKLSGLPALSSIANLRTVTRLGAGLQSRGLRFTERLVRSR